MKGSELYKWLKELISPEMNSLKWELMRESSKNSNVHVKGIILTGSLSNSSIGKAIDKNYNFLISFEKLYSEEMEFRLKYLIETLYKNDLFVLSLGKMWLFNTALARMIIAKIFQTTPRNIHVEKSNNLFYLLYDEKINLKLILNRFSNYIIQDSFSKEDDTFHKNPIKLIISFEFNSEILNLLKPDILIITEINHRIQDYCYINKIILIYLQREQIYSEIVRELYFFIRNNLFNINIELYFNKIKKLHFDEMD